MAARFIGLVTRAVEAGARADCTFRARINPQGKGIGFAIPIDEVKRELPTLIARGRLGVTIQGMDDTLAKALGLDRARGPLVENVQPGGPAALGSIQAGDVILSVDGQEVSQAVDLPRMIAQHAPGSRVRLGVLRDKQIRDFEVTLAEIPQTPPGVTSKQPAPRLEGGSLSALGFAVSNAP